MSYIFQLALAVVLIFLSSSSLAVQIELRGFHSQTQLSHKKSEVPVSWSGSYANGSPAATEGVRPARQNKLQSFGQEVNLGIPLWPHLNLALGLAQTVHFTQPNERIEDLSPKLGLEIIFNIQDRWMPFVRLGVSQHQLKLVSTRIESRSIPAALGLAVQEDRFGIRREWTDQPQLWNGDIGLGCKFYLYPTTSINVEYRYSGSFHAVSLQQREVGISSYRDEPSFISESRLQGSRLSSQEYSLAAKLEL